jgi:hypothetical protein
LRASPEMAVVANATANKNKTNLVSFILDTGLPPLVLSR